MGMHLPMLSQHGVPLSGPNQIMPDSNMPGFASFGSTTFSSSGDGQHGMQIGPAGVYMQGSQMPGTTNFTSFTTNTAGDGQSMPATTSIFAGHGMQMGPSGAIMPGPHMPHTTTFTSTTSTSRDGQSMPATTSIFKEQHGMQSSQMPAFNNSFTEFRGCNMGQSETTSTSIVNGKQITTKRITGGGDDRVERYEDGKLVSVTVNGQEQLANK